MDITTAITIGLNTVISSSMATLGSGSYSCGVYKSFGPQTEYQMLAGGFDKESPDLQVIAKVSDISTWNLVPHSLVTLDNVSYSIDNPITKTTVYWLITLKERK